MDSLQASKALAAMASVATRGGTQPLTVVDQATVEAAWRLRYLQDTPLNVANLPPVTPQELAQALPEPASREWVAQSLAVMPFVDGQLDREKAGRVAQFGAALGVQEDFIAEMHRVAEGKLAGVLACMMRENILSIHNGPWPGQDTMAYFLPWRTAPDSALKARHEALAALAPGTLGFEWHCWYGRNGFALPGDPDALCTEFAWPHDTAHLLSGYNSTPHGELLVSTFTAGMHPQHPMEGHILPVIFSWHLGIQLNSVAKSARGAFDPELFWEAWERGAGTRTDVFAPGWDFWGACQQPLPALREAYGVTPSQFPAERVSL